MKEDGAALPSAVITVCIESDRAVNGAGEESQETSEIAVLFASFFYRFYRSSSNVL